MMNTSKAQSLKRQILKLSAMLPIMGMLFFIQSCDFQQQEMEEITVEAGEEIGEATEEITTSYQDDQVFTIVEEQPKFPGGDNELMRFLTANLRYPDQARESGIQGTVFVTFVVEPDGSITDVRILRGIGGGIDEEAIRVVNAMPTWIPGKQSGEEVRVQFNLPIRFVLN